MKEGWKYKKLGEVISFQNGFAFKSSLFRKDGLPIVRISSIQDEEIKETDLVRFYPSDYDVNFDNYKILPNDILIAMSGGTTGKLGINKSDKVYYQNQRVGVIRENKKCLDHLFLYYFLHTKSEESLKIAAGAAQPNLSTAQIKDFVIPLPPLSEQQRIVSRLDSAFAHIDELKANAEKQLSEARALFQKALTKAMEPKEGWEKKKMKEIAQVKIGPFGSLLHKRDYISGGIPLVNPIHMIEGKIVANNDYTISEEKAKELSAYLLRTNDVIFARRGEIGRCAIVSSNEDGFLCGTGSLFVRFKAKVDNAFMQMLFQSEVCKNYLLKSASGATMLNINAGIVEEMPLTIPPLSEQQRIVSRLDSLSAHVRELEEVTQKTIAECDALKQALLRQVFE